MKDFISNFVVLFAGIAGIYAAILMPLLILFFGSTGAFFFSYLLIITIPGMLILGVVSGAGSYMLCQRKDEYRNLFTCAMRRMRRLFLESRD